MSKKKGTHENVTPDAGAGLFLQKGHHHGSEEVITHCYYNADLPCWSISKKRTLSLQIKSR